MNNHVFRGFRQAFFLALLCFGGFFATPTISAAVPLQEICQEDNFGLQITTLSAASVSLSWNAWGGPGAYTVRVRLLDTGTVVQQFLSNSTSAVVSGLMPGISYLVQVEKAGNIIEDVVH